MVLDTRGDALQAATRIRPEYLYETSRAVSRMMHFPIAYNKPVVGRNAFQHESGIHQDGLLKNRSTYEIMDPVKLGIPHHMIVLGKHSGRHALKHRAEQYGVHLNAGQLNEVYDRFKHVADVQKVVTDDQLLQCIGEALNEQLEPLSLLDVEVVAGTDRKRAASVTVQEQVTGKKQTYAGVGSGPIEAVIRALSQAVREPIRFEDLELHSLSSGEEASGEAVVTVSLDDQVYQEARRIRISCWPRPKLIWLLAIRRFAAPVLMEHLLKRRSSCPPSVTMYPDADVDKVIHISC